MAKNTLLVRAIFLSTVLLAASSWAASVSSPTAPVPAARFATGASYDYFGGYLHKPRVAGVRIDDLPFKMNGVNAFFTYAPATSINIGVDLGMRNVSLPQGDFEFNGKMGIAAGSHLKLSTPYFGDVMGIIAICRGLWFYSEDRNDRNAYYSGMDFTGAGGLSFHIKNIGYVSLGAKYFEIVGENSNEGNNRKWSNDATLGGFVSFDFFPQTNMKNQIPFISLEFGFFPNDKPFYGGSPAIRNASFGVTIGAITHPLYGNSDRNWRP